MCLALTALCACSFAQPRIEVKGSDTSAVVPIGNLRSANVQLAELDECWELNNGFNLQEIDYILQINSLQSSIDDLKTVDDLNRKILAEKENTIALKDKQLAADQRRIKWLKMQRFGLTTAVLLLTGRILL